MTTAIVKGSLTDVSKRAGQSLAESFLSADALVIVDTSASMSDEDARDGKSRYTVACEELARLQETMSGKVGVVSFSDTAEFCPSGVPRFFCGRTYLAEALLFVKPADDTGMRFIVISDGGPNDEAAALAIARTFRSKIDTIYVGPAGGEGADFLKRLASAAGGRGVTADRALELAKSVSTLMLGGGR